jgi:serine/threonine-protein kinase
LRADAARVVENVAASIADGAQVDWVQADAQVGGRELRLVRHLRIIDSVAGVYRTLPSLVEDESGPSPRPDFPEGPRWGRLILLDRIGRGASADVFRAWDAELQREVALKLLHDEGPSSKANARLLQEARRLARIRHPHVVHVYGAERHEEQIGLWMEFVRGRSLDDIVRDDGAIDPAETAHIGIDLCSALSAVHGAGLLHRDVKAQNVIREDSGRLVLMDFGTGEEMTDQTPRLAGTPIYLAPEVLARRPASVQSDIYAVGVLLFHALTGAFPVVGESLDALAAAHKEGRYRTVRELQPRVPAGLARVVDRALAPDPRRRYASASAMEAALHQALDTLPGRRPLVSTVWWVIASAVAAMIVLVVALAGNLRSGVSSTGPPNTVAVLPLRSLSGDAEAPYLADGLTDQLITTLGQIHSLNVIGQTSVARFKGTDAPIAEVARQLGVDSVVEGTVMVQKGTGNQPSRARVNIRLIRAGSDIDVWSGSLERPLGDLLALESELARTITRQLRGVLTPDESAHLRTSRKTDPAAEQAYFEGRAHLALFTTHAQHALDAFNRTLAIDPSHAGAHSGAARSYIALGFARAISQAEARASALREATRALELDDSLAEAHGVLGDIKFFYDWDWAGAEREYRRAIELGPSTTYIRGQYAQFLGAMGRPAEARMEAEDAARLNPLSAEDAVALMLILYYGRQYDEAIGAADHASLLDPSSMGVEFLRGRILEAQGELDQAAAATDRAIEGSETVALGWKVQAVRLQALRGHQAEARAAFDRLLAEPGAENLASSPYEAYLRLALGESDKALAILGHAVRSRDPGVLFMTVDPRLDPLRPLPEFSALLKQMGLPRP